MKKILIKASIIIGSMLVVLFIGCSYYIGLQVFSGSTQLVTNADTTGISDTFWEKYDIDYEEFCETYKIEKIQLESSFDGHTIPADYIYSDASNGNKDNKTVVLVHGLGGNRLSNYPVAEMFLEHGYNIITYDQRSSNENTAKYTTFGYWEKFDLIDCIDFIQQYSDEQLGVWGTSFGGATAGLAMGYKDTQQKVDFVILDCPVSSMKWMVENEMKQMNIGLPISYMRWCGNVINKHKLKFSYNEADVSSAMKNVDIPVLIINSKADVVTPYFMGQDIFDSIKNGENKQIWTVDDSKHADIWLDYKEDYIKKVEALLKKVS